MKIAFYRNILTLLLLSQCLVAQENISFVLKGKILDEETKEIIIGANIYNRYFDEGTSSDNKGTFKLKIEQMPVFLEVSYVGYEDTQIRIEEIKKEPITIFLKSSVRELPSAVVSATRPTDELLDKKDRIIDFEFYGENLFLLIKNLNTKEERLELRNTKNDVIDTTPLEKLNGKKRFHKNCLGSVNLINGKNVFPIAMEEDIILGLSKPMAFHTYDWEVMKCVLANRQNVYYQLFTNYGKEVLYHLFEKDRDTNYVFTSVYDEVQINLFYEDMVPLMMADESTNTAEITDPNLLSNLRDKQETLDARMQFFYQPIYAPLFQFEKELILFDHFNGFIKFFDEAGTFHESVKISFQTKKNWDEKIIQDESTGNFYTFFSTKTGKSICKINIERGTLEEPVYINTAGTDKVLIKSGKLYFLEQGMDPVFNYSINILKKVSLN